MNRFLLAVLFALLLPTAAWSKTWAVDAKASSLKFTGIYQEEPFVGTFPFKASIIFDAAKLATSQLDVEISVTGVNSENEERDTALADPVWFDFAKYPQARFVTESISRTATGYVAQANLTIRGISRKIKFPFTFVESKGAAKLTAQVTLNRLDFGLGAGEWEDAELIAHEVQVDVVLTLR